MFKKKNIINRIDIFDIDGTLTYVFGDIPDTLGYSTYSFWPLISLHFSKDKKLFQKMTAEWEESMKTELDPTTSSHNMMQKSIDIFQDNVTSNDLYFFAKELTYQFIRHNVIRKEAIQYLEFRIKQGVFCILSTGSYEEGALGFLDALVESGMLSSKSKQSIRVSGAIVDWKMRVLVHANVRDRKILGIEQTMNQKIDCIIPCLENVYGDDPWINDYGLFSIAPKSGAHVIMTSKNKNEKLPFGLVFTSWNKLRMLAELKREYDLKAEFKIPSKL